MPGHANIRKLIENLERLQRQNALDNVQGRGRTPRWSVRLLEPIGKELAPIFAKPGGQLQDQLDELWDFCKQCPGPNTLAFVPSPNSSVRMQRRLYPLHLLVLVAAAFAPVGTRIVPRLKLLKPPASGSRTYHVRAKAALEQHATDTGAPQLVDDLIRALKCLQDLLPAGLSLDDEDYVVVDGSRILVKLKGQQLAFVRTLINAAGQAVSKAEFIAKGVKNPAKVKQLVVNKPNFAFLEVRIVTVGKGGYELIADC